jgi:type I restriction enzyme, S subunit
VFRSSGFDARFLGYYLNTAEIAAQKATMGQGDAVVHISSAALAGLEVNLPELSEQKAIASILTDMDDELDHLEIKRTKVRDIKQGMMQELLTGSTRLVPSAHAHVA